MTASSRGTLAILIATVLWSTSGTAAGLAPATGPLVIAAASWSVGGLLQAIVASRAIRQARGRLWSHHTLVLVGGVAVATYPLAFYTSVHLGGVAIGTVVSLGSAPVAAGLVERLTKGSRLSRRWLAAVALAIAGSCLLCVSKSQAAPESAMATLASVLLGLVAGTSYALFSWAGQRMMQHGLTRSASMGSMFGLGGLLLVPVLIATVTQDQLSVPSMAVIGYSAVITVFVAYLLFGTGLQWVPVSTATTLTMAQPAIATLLAVIALGEQLGTLGWVGLALIGIGIIASASRPAKTDVLPYEPRAVTSTEVPAQAGAS